METQKVRTCRNDGEVCAPFIDKWWAERARKIAFGELVTFQAEAGTNGKMSEYRRLISAGCGGVEPAEVDQVLGMLLEVSAVAHYYQLQTYSLG